MAESTRIQATEIVLLAATVALAAVLRLWQLGLEGMWADECQSVYLAHQPLSRLFAAAQGETQAPLYYLLLRALPRTAPAVAWIWRLPSVLASLATVVALWWCGRRLLSPGGGLLTALLWAISPFAIAYAQEARCYSLLAALTTVAFIALIEMTRRPRWWVSLGFGAAMLAMLYTHNIAVFYVMGLGLVALASSLKGGPHHLRCVVLAAGVVAVGYLPWLGHMLSQAGEISDSYAWAASMWRSELPWQVPRSLAAIGFGALAPIRNRVADLGPAAWVGLLFSAMLTVAAVVSRKRLRDPAAPVLLVLALLVPLVGLFIVCWLRDAPTYVVGRVDAAAQPLLVLLLGAGAHALRPRWRFMIAVACAGLSVQPLYVYYRIDFRSQEKRMVATIATLRRPGEVVLSNYYHHCIQCQLGLEDGETHLMYPSQYHRHPSWVRWSDLDASRARSDAMDVIDRAILLSREHKTARVWVLLHRYERYADVLEQALSERLVLQYELDMPKLHSRLCCYRIDPGNAG